MPKLSIKLDITKPQATIKFYNTNTSINLPIASSLKAPITEINRVSYNCNNNGIYFASLQDNLKTFIQKDVTGILKGSKGFIFARFNKNKENKDIFEVCLQTNDKNTFQVYSQPVIGINIPDGYSNTETTTDKTIDVAAHAVASIAKVFNTPRVIFESNFISNLTGASIDTEHELSLIYQDSLNSFNKNLGERIGENTGAIDNFFDTPKAKPKK